jgi:adenylate kinase family enzyme
MGMRRVSVVGSSGWGKSTVGRSSDERPGVPLAELDAIHHLQHWTRIGPEGVLRQVGAVSDGDASVVDGTYGHLEFVRIRTRREIRRWFDARLISRRRVPRTPSKDALLPDRISGGPPFASLMY